MNIILAFAFSSSSIIHHQYTCGLLVPGSLFLTILENYHTILLLHLMGRGIPSVKAKFTHYWEDRQIKGFHLNVNQKGNKSIIVIWKRRALFAFHVMSLTLFYLSLWPRRYVRLSKSFCGNKLQADVTQSWDDAFIWLSYFNKHPCRWIGPVLISCGPTASFL